MFPTNKLERKWVYYLIRTQGARASATMISTIAVLSADEYRKDPVHPVWLLLFHCQHKPVDILSSS